MLKQAGGFFGSGNLNQKGLRIRMMNRLRSGILTDLIIWTVIVDGDAEIACSGFS
jgi:hypothetical protein